LSKRALDVEEVVYQQIRVTKGDGIRYTLNGREIDIWDREFSNYHSKKTVDYIREAIVAKEKRGEDLFPDIVGKEREKELVATALFSGSPILFRGERGYGKTTFSKAIAKLLPEKILAIKGCKIHDDPTAPICFSCKSKILLGETIELTWVPRIWVRIPGDPMLTTRQLIGGISIQKIREGYDLDHPEVFTPGKALKANRGIGYFDELGAVPTALQTLLHELFEEHQVSTSEGETVPLRLDLIEIASTNPANYRGTSPIKEPLLDRMEIIDIGPPASVEEEIEIARRNSFIGREKRFDVVLPDWHMRLMAYTVMLGRNPNECDTARKIQTPPSCRATIKLFDHLASRVIRGGRRVPLLKDYGEDLEVVTLALAGRIELEYGVRESRAEVSKMLFKESLLRIAKEVYDKIPSDRFDDIIAELISVGTPKGGVYSIPVDLTFVKNLRGLKHFSSAVYELCGGYVEDDEFFLSAAEILLYALSMCAPRYVVKGRSDYLVKKVEEK
jgi:magnesium chelatase subunit I